VPGARSVRGHGFVERIESELEAAGFAAKAHLLRATDFGVPQRRMRYFFLGVRDRRRRPPSRPPATHAALVDPAPGTDSSNRTPTVVETLKRVPTVGPGHGERWLETSDGQAIANVQTMRHSPRVIKKISAIEPGKGPISYRRLGLDEARTIIAGHRALPVHPLADRTLSVREAALLQGFGVGYAFCGPPAEQPLQVGYFVACCATSNSRSLHCYAYSGFTSATNGCHRQSRRRTR
jgi:DNA (cytosine-5)-methyltransferase 1